MPAFASSHPPAALTVAPAVAGTGKRFTLTPSTHTNEQVTSIELVFTISASSGNATWNSTQPAAEIAGSNPPATNSDWAYTRNSDTVLTWRYVPTPVPADTDLAVRLNLTQHNGNSPTIMAQLRINGANVGDPVQVYPA